jgi:hypothetical protein
MIPSECGCSRIAAEAAKVDLGWLQNVASQAKSHPDRLSIATLASRVLAPRPRRYRHHFRWPAASLDPGCGRRRSAAIGSRPLQDQNHNGPSPVGLGAPPVPTRGRLVQCAGPVVAGVYTTSPNRRQTTATSSERLPQPLDLTRTGRRPKPASEGRLRDRVGGMNAGRPRLPEQRLVAISRGRPDGMILVTVSCATEAIHRKRLP